MVAKGKDRNGHDIRVRGTGEVQCGFRIAGYRIRNVFVHKKTGHHSVTGFQILYSVPYDFWRTFAASFAKYVRIMSAPARLIEMSDSIMARSPSIQPILAAALMMEYSPLTL